MLTIRIDGLDELRARLGNELTPHLRALTSGVANQIMDEIKPYPPATEANRPHTQWKPGARWGRTQWYVRGEGPHWLVKGKRTTKVAGGIAIHERTSIMGIEHFSHTSEQLGQQWHIEPEGETGQVVYNSASYGQFVHAAAHQARFHAERGWRTDEQAIATVVASGEIERMTHDFIVNWLGK